MNRNDDREYFRKPEDYRLVSNSSSNYVHVEGYEKVTGKAKYAGDYIAPGMLYCKAKYSPFPHAKILRVDTSRAEALPGVKCVLTGADFERKIGGHANVPGSGDVEVLNREFVRSVGDPVAAVCAVDEQTAAEGAELVEVEYEVLPAVFCALEAMKEGAPDVQSRGLNDCNIGIELGRKAGNNGKTTEEEFEKASFVMHTDYKTTRGVHGSIEPYGSYAEYNPQDELFTIYTSTTSTFFDQAQLANVFGMDESHFHVLRPYVGGAFGGKSTGCRPFTMFVACEMARRTGKPVRFVLTREEEFQTRVGRHGYDIHLDTAYDKDGKLLAKHAVNVIDGGAYGGSQVAAVWLSVVWNSLPYKIDAIDYLSQRVFTNLPYCGAVRGYMANQVHFASELEMEEASYRMGIDPVEFRLRNAVERGYHSPIGVTVTSCAFRDTLKDTAEYMQWEQRKDKLEPGEGIGIAASGFVSGLAGPILNTPNQEQTNATVRVDFNGIVALYSNCHDQGQGADTVMTMMVAEELGLDMSDVKHIRPSTFNAGLDTGAYGSRVTFFGGNATRRAAVEVKKKLLECIAAKWGVEPHLLDLVDHKVVCRDMGKTELEMPWKEAVFHYMACHGGDELVGVGSYYHRTAGPKAKVQPEQFSPAYVFSTCGAHVHVDEETGVVDIDDIFFAHDCGQALNKRAVEGQIEGSVINGLGFGIYENMFFKEGRIINPNFHDYKMPTALDAPPIHTKFDYPPDEEGPFGAKECGEGTPAPVAPAIACAIQRAVGIRITQLPMDPEHIWRLMREKKASAEK